MGGGGLLLLLILPGLLIFETPLLPHINLKCVVFKQFYRVIVLMEQQPYNEVKCTHFQESVLHNKECFFAHYTTNEKWNKNIPLTTPYKTLKKRLKSLFFHHSVNMYYLMYNF